MSYGVAAALQAAVFSRLSGDETLAGLVGEAIFDAAPPGTLPPLYVALGSEDASDRSDMTGHGAAHDIIVSVIGESGGFLAAKAAAAAVSDALNDAGLTLERGHLVSMRFLSARARLDGDGAARRIDLRFRARVEDE
jgi:hypothetical protein